VIRNGDGILEAAVYRRFSSLFDQIRQKNSGQKNPSVPHFSAHHLSAKTKTVLRQKNGGQKKQFSGRKWRAEKS